MKTSNIDTPTIYQRLLHFISGNKSKPTVVKQTPLRGCPKDANDYILLQNNMYDVFYDIIPSELYQTMDYEFEYAKVALCQNWSSQPILPRVPDTLDAPFECKLDRYSERLSYTVWVLWFEHKTSIYYPYGNRGHSFQFGESMSFIDKADTMPEGVLQAAKVTIGVTQVDNVLRGFYWELFSNLENGHV